MKLWARIVLTGLIFLSFVAFTFYYISNYNVPVLHPKGLIAAKERDLLITASLLMLIVIIPVFFFTMIFAWVYRDENKKAKYTPDWGHSNTAEFFWWGVPLLIITALAIITWKSTHDLNPFKPLTSTKKPLSIQVVALEWKWLFIYPEQNIATVNFVQFPKDVPINFEITADAPMNSFWIPQLGGQIYAMPAMRTKLHLIAHEEGDYRGSSANISGKGFAGMVFTARVSSEETFEDWVSKVKNSSESLDAESYSRLVMPSEYNPPAFYAPVSSQLFDKILEKYMVPEGEYAR